MAEAFGNDEGIPPPRASALERVVWGSWGLSPERVFDGTDTGDVFAEGETADLLRLVLELFLRSINGIDGPRPSPGDMGLLLRDKLSRMLLISGGIGTEWTTLTECQSAACTRRCSLGLGGRQHPGQPGLSCPDI